MSTTMLPPSPKTTKSLSDERREWIRIDDRVLLEYRLLTDSTEEPIQGLPVSNEAIAAVIAKPTSDLLLRSGGQLAESPLLPWIMKVDWLLEVIVKALAKMQPEGIAIAQVADVTLSGGGIGFLSRAEFCNRRHVKVENYPAALYTDPYNSPCDSIHLGQGRHAVRHRVGIY